MARKANYNEMWYLSSSHGLFRRHVCIEEPLPAVLQDLAGTIVG